MIKRYKQLTRLSVISGNIWYHLTWLMMLDIIMRVTFLHVQNIYPATRFIFQNFDKNGILIIKSNMQLRRLSVMSGNIWSDLVFYNFLRNLLLVADFLQIKQPVTYNWLPSNWLLVANFLQIKQPVTSNNWLLVANFSW